MLFIRLFLESFRFAYNSLVVNQLRTFLSLLGITIGIFCIISVFTIIDSLERTIRDSMSKLGSNVIYIQKWPWVKVLLLKVRRTFQHPDFQKNSKGSCVQSGE